MDQDVNIHGKPSSVSSKVRFEVKIRDSIRRFVVQVRIDPDDNVSLKIPEDFIVDDEDVSVVTVRTSAKVKVLPDILSTSFGSDRKLFFSACSVFVSLDFVKNVDGLLKCSHCNFNVNVKEVHSKEFITETLLQHLPQHQDYLPCLKFSCKKCPTFSVVSVDLLIKHFEQVHPETLIAKRSEPETTDTEDRAEYKCPICSIICFNNKALMCHMKVFHSSQPSQFQQLLPDDEDMQNGIEVAPGIVVKQEPTDYDEDEEGDYGAVDSKNDSKYEASTKEVKSEPSAEYEDTKYCSVKRRENGVASEESLAQKSQLLKVDLTLDGQFGCLICGKMCRNEKALKKHVQIHIVGFQPDKDVKKDPKKPKKNRKFKKSSLPKVYKCKICKEPFESPQAVNKHKRLAHPVDLPKTIIESKVSGDLKLTLKMDQKNDRRKQGKPQKSEDLAQETRKEETEDQVDEDLKEDCDDYTNDPSFDQSDILNEADHDPYSDEPRNLRKRRKKQNFSRECPICHKVLTRANSMVVHMRSHTGEKPFKCKQCGRGCQTAQHLKQHMLIHTGEQPYECAVCKRKFRDPSSKKRHMRLHEAGRPIRQFIKPTLVLNPETGDMKEVLLDPKDGTPIKVDHDDGEVLNFMSACDKKGLFPCPICNKVFTSASSLATHHRSHTGERPYSCSFCDKTFLTSQHVKHHEMIHTGEKPHVCSECGKAFIARSSLKRHEEIHNTNRTPRPPKNKPEAECEICGKQFMYAKSLIEHRRIHTRERPFSCTVCDKTFARIGNLRIHMFQHTGMYKYRCSHCGKGCVTASQLRVHESIHTGIKPHVCSTCGKGFADPHRLKIHEYNHTDQKPHVCNICGKGYGTNTLLKFHKRKHTGEKPYLCTFCGKGFAFQKNMRDHQLTHTGELPFSCDHCGKGFRTNWLLTCHRRLHTGEKPYRCPKCGEAFRAHSSLYSHIRRHKISEGILPRPLTPRNQKSPKPKVDRPKKPEKPKSFFCNNCKKGFVRKESLKKHMRKNEACRIATNYIETGRKDPGVTAFQCEVCQKYFSGYPALYRHRKLHERREDTDRFNCDLCEANFWRNDHLLVHKRTVHPDQGTDNFLLKKQGRPVPVTGITSVPGKTLTIETPSLDTGLPVPQLQPQQHQQQQHQQQHQQQQQQQQHEPSEVLQGLSACITDVASANLSPLLIPKNLTTNNKLESIPGQEELLQPIDGVYLHRQGFQPQLHQPQFPYPQMISAQAFLQGAMSHLAQQQQQQQHQVQMSVHHPQYNTSNDRHAKTNQFLQ